MGQLQTLATGGFLSKLGVQVTYIVADLLLVLADSQAHLCCLVLEKSEV
jgi:hypothetical protein